MCLRQWPALPQVCAWTCLCVRPCCVCESRVRQWVFFSFFFSFFRRMPACQVADYLRLIIRPWQKAAGSSHSALMKPGPWLIGDTMAWGNERGSYQTGRTKRRGQRIRPSRRGIKLVTFICRAYGGSAHLHSPYQNTAKAKNNLPVAWPATGLLTMSLTNRRFSFQSSPLCYALSRLHALLSQSKSRPLVLRSVLQSLVLFAFPSE